MNTKQTTWNLSPLLKNNASDDFAELRTRVEIASYEFINKWKGREDYLKDSLVLKQALDEYEEWHRNYGAHSTESYYFWLKSEQDQNDPKIKAGFKKVSEISKRIENDIRFFELKISKIPSKEQVNFLESKELLNYKHFLEKSFLYAKYLLSEKEESLLSLKFSTSHENWVKMVSGLVSKEEAEIILGNESKEKKNFSEIMSLLSSRNKKTRDSASEALNRILHKYSDVAEAEINSILENKKTDDELRKMDRPDLERHIDDDIETAVVDAMIKAVSEKFEVSKKYYALKAKLLGVKILQYHERNVPYGETNKKYSYEESLELIKKTFVKLDPSNKLSNILNGLVENSQMDIYPKKGKSSGAFCARGAVSLPTYILLNHTDRMEDVLTMAHELGHGINNELIKEKQNSLNFGTPLSTAEVASTFMEDFVLEEIKSNADEELRLSILMNKLNNDISTIFRQVACYKFEKELHENFRNKGYLSKEEIGKIFQKNMSAYMGDAVEQSTGSENWWIYWSHIRRFFYVYSYASGLLISKSLQNSVKENGVFIEKVKNFLSVGLSSSPSDIFIELDIDIKDKVFWEKGLAEVEKLLDETEKLAIKLGKI